MNIYYEIMMQVSKTYRLFLLLSCAMLESVVLGFNAFEMWNNFFLVSTFPSASVWRQRVLCLVKIDKFHFRK